MGNRRGCGGWASKRVRQHRDRAFVRQGGKCHYCQRQMNQDYEKPNSLTCTAEHLIPLADGGRNGRANIVAACGRCNHGRSTEASKENNRLQRLNLINPQPIRNPSVAHALIEAFGMDYLREVLRAARNPQLTFLPAAHDAKGNSDG